MSPGVRRAKIDKLIGILIDAGLTQNGISDEPATDISQSETIRTSPMKHIIRGLRPPAPGMNSITMVGFPGMYLLRSGITALTLLSPTRREYCHEQE
jgi:hypothetical protein